MTAEINYKKKQRQWSVYHKFEQKDKKRSLKELSATEGFRIFDELYRFAHRLSIKPSFKRLDMDKVKALADIHYKFGKIKV